jgi:hypothetical protein
LLGLFFFAGHAFASGDTYDCAGFQPFKPIDTLKADVTVYRFNKYIPGQGNKSVDEADEVVCESKTPVVVQVKDIRGREADWYYCDKPAPENYLVCDTEYKAKPAKIAVKPAMVIRSWKPQDALDTHMHVNLIPENDESRILDNFTQALGSDLAQRDLTLNGSAGGRGPNSDQDYYYVRVRLHKK